MDFPDTDLDIYDTPEEREEAIQNAREDFQDALDEFEADVAERELFIIQEHHAYLMQQIARETAENPDRQPSAFEVMTAIQNVSNVPYARTLALTPMPSHQGIPSMIKKLTKIGATTLPAWQLRSVPDAPLNKAFIISNCRPLQKIILIDMKSLPAEISDLIRGQGKSKEPAYNHECFIWRKKNNHAASLLIHNGVDFAVIHLNAIRMLRAHSAKDYVQVNATRAFDEDGASPLVIFSEMQDRTECIDVHEFVSAYLFDKVKLVGPAKK